MAAMERDLWRLARWCGLRPAYTDYSNRRRRAAPETVLAALRAWGAPIDSPSQAARLLRDLDRQRWRCALEPVSVVWEDAAAPRSGAIHVRLPEDETDRPAEIEIEPEDGGSLRRGVDLARAPVRETVQIDSRRYVQTRIDLPGPLPAGYHRASLRWAGRSASTLLIVAPPSVYRAHPQDHGPRGWGVFIPLYALRTRTSWGAGNLSDLRELTRWTARRGGGIVGTLPLLAQFLDDPAHISPYSPVSRLFFSELYIDAESAPEFAACEQSRRIAQSERFRAEKARLSSGDEADPVGVMALKRAILSPLAEAFFAAGDERLRALERRCNEDAHLARYAAFRAAGARHGRDWRAWPRGVSDRLRPGPRSVDGGGGDFDDREYRYHLYVQFLLHEQLSHLGDSLRREDGTGLYLDLPVGVHPDGYDAWWFADSLVEGVSAGAPPDDFFSLGQSWGFAPIHPQRSREQGHEWVIRSLRAHMRYSGCLRIDHVMWLHRMYWTFTGASPADGLYARSPAEELYAIVCLESHRHRCEVVGENLGTVPDEVNRAMRRRRLRGMYVGQFSFRPQTAEDGDGAGSAKNGELLAPAPVGSFADLNTHDTPTFAAFWSGDDIDLRVELGFLEQRRAAEERCARADLRRRVLRWLAIDGRGEGECAPETIRAVLAGLLEHLGRGDAGIVLVNMEDLWLERRPQNVPGTELASNWRGRAAMSLERAGQDQGVAGVLEALKHGRKGGRR